MATQSTSSSKASNNNAIGIKETLTSLLIAFMLAFLFRGFVIEGFQIPTGSMAPTLLGKHVRFTSPYSGYDWSVGPWTYADPARTIPVQQQDDITVNDPMSGLVLNDTHRRLAAGDRVFVLKYLPLLESPQRWDVVVFKNPGTHENYIKRLVGLPGEQLAFVDGDVFVRDAVEGQSTESGWDAWTEPGWTVARKSERVQRAMFQDVYSSRYVPEPVQAEYRAPFTGSTNDWDGISSGSSYRYTGMGPTSLRWNGVRDLTDANSYNQTLDAYKLFAKSDNFKERIRPFPDSDVSVEINIQFDDQAIAISPVLEARGMEFRAVVQSDGSGSTNVSVEMRSAEQADAIWTELDSDSISGFKSKSVHHIEFWHVDQALWLFVDDKLVCGGAEKGSYELSPAQRAIAATGKGWDELERSSSAGNGIDSPGIFARPEIYRKPTFHWSFSGGPFTLSDVSVRRDISYQINRNGPTRGGHPDNFPTMNGKEFFMCGDNSERSADSRIWRSGELDRWVKSEISDRAGMVHRDLIVGRAFLVYFPALLDDGPVLTPDVGRMRWIW
ncbi:MAG: signal peptidase I [Phycisphaerales bacterium]|nr:signal peptidase I [Phycisphaerales bacterium]